MKESRGELQKNERERKKETDRQTDRHEKARPDSET